ncbi:MAG TPA: hypothetical protein VHZ33_20895 [Trebonia sp.]|jgi:hypothetical protein|nr:hypothetical protein [Trebonia sp.]
MDIRKLAAPTAALATGLAVLGAVGGTAQASSVPLVDLSVPNISITGMHTVDVGGKVTDPGAMGQYDIAAWGIAPNYADFNNETYPGYLGDLTYSAEIGYEKPLFFPGNSPLGEYHAYPDPSENLKQGDNWSQNTPSFAVKEGSRISLSVSRSTSRVTFRLTSTRYNDDLNFGLSGAWQRWDNVNLSIQFQSGSSWKTVKTVSSGKTGNAAVTITYAAARDWRAVDGATGTIWGATSATVKK